MKRIVSDIKNSTFAPMYLIYGEQRYLCRYYTNELRNALGDISDEMNNTVYSGKDIDVKALIDMAQTLPFFAPRRVIVVKDSGFFKGSHEEMAEYLKNPSEDTVIIFSEQEVDKRSKTYKALTAKGYAACMDSLDEASLIKWTGTYFAKSGINITQSTVKHLIDRIGTDMDMIRNESDKLISFVGDKGVIEPSDIDNIVVNTVTSQIFDMTDYIAAGNSAKALGIYADLLAQKESPLMILFMITKMFRQLYEVKTFSGIDMPAKLSLHPFVAKKYANLAKNFTKEKLRDATEYGAALEYDIKSGKMDDKMSVELFIVRYS